MSSSQPSELSTEEIVAQLPAGCIGTNVRLSWALYCLSFEHTDSEAIAAIHEFSGLYGSDITLEHFLLLPEREYQWILRGLAAELESHAEISPDAMLKGCSNYLPRDGSFGLALYDLAPKRWATSFFHTAIQKRPAAKNP